MAVEKAITRGYDFEPVFSNYNSLPEVWASDVVRRFTCNLPLGESGMCFHAFSSYR